MYAINCLKFLKMKSLPSHEEAMREGILYEVVEREGIALGREGTVFKLFSTTATGERGGAVLLGHGTSPTDAMLINGAQLVAVSHQWLRPNIDPTKAHPDSVDNEKLETLKSAIHKLLFEPCRNRSNIPVETRHTYIWMDYFSIPQDPNARKKQVLAIASLPCYFVSASTILVLCKDMATLRNSQVGYLSRGHCLMELCSSKLPRKDIYGKWYIPGFKRDGSWGTALACCFTGELVKLQWSDFVDAGSPVLGNFTVESDRDHMRPLLESYIASFEQFESHLRQFRVIDHWSQVDLNAAESIQFTNASRDFKTPREWADSVLPLAYLKALKR